MSASEKEKTALHRSEYLINSILKITNNIPINLVRDKIQEPLKNINSAIQGLRPPKIMVIGRSRSGKSSLINAICGLKVSEISHIKPETGASIWNEYYHGGSKLLRILDTRGLQESEAPRQRDCAKTPIESIQSALKKECPDIILFLCKATEVHSASTQDLDDCETIVKFIQDRYARKVSIIGVLTKCDEVAPPRIDLPTDNAKKIRNIEECVQNFYAYLKERDILRSCIEKVVPTVAYAEYEEGGNGLIIPEQDYRWNITILAETMMKYIPENTRGSLARMAHLSGFQKTVARTIVTSCSILCAFCAVTPIPGLDIPIINAIQSFMVTYIAWIAGRKFSVESIGDFVTVSGTFGLTDLVLKSIPGFGMVISVGMRGMTTQLIGEAAIKYFLEENVNQSVPYSVQV